ncbi:helix loop helix DNA-binding domain protein [Medicago truncatula]|uniref:Helix loop helix DNA-binding domain protein n=1 Tax=Medicago truncatula TaxID=3880 RepID=A0A072VKE6_MEDTR|nr:helix loop helix DNA-binding domain protein [Medicago truncatula]
MACQKTQGTRVLEFNRVTASVGKGRGGKATEHFATEKQRRKQLNGKCKILRDLILIPLRFMLTGPILPAQSWQVISLASIPYPAICY